MNYEYNIISTFSIVAYDPENGDLGVAVASKFLAVGHLVPWVEVDVGAIATQSYANVKFGPEGLRLLKKGFKPKEVVEKLLSGDTKKEYRQIGIASRDGAYAYTGVKCMEWAGHIIGDYYAVQGNLLVSEEVVSSMAYAFEHTKGELVDKLISALEAGDKAGGDRRGRQSASIIVLRRCGGYGGCEEGVDKYVDIRVDDHPDPISELKRIFKIWEILFLEREGPDDLFEWNDIWRDVSYALRILGYLEKGVHSPDDPHLIQAFKTWIAINNFENKFREDGRVWRSIYEYLIDEARKKDKTHIFNKKSDKHISNQHNLNT